MRWGVGIVLAAALVASAAGKASDKDKKDKTKPEAARSVDSGSFGIFIKNQRVATETFSIQQLKAAASSSRNSKQTVGADPTSQKSDLEITSNGELIRYEWSQSSGGSLVVFPDNDFLKEKITTSATAKAAEQPFLLPSLVAHSRQQFLRASRGAGLALPGLRLQNRRRKL